MSSPEDIIVELGYQDVKVLRSPDYTDALVGVTVDNQAVYDYNLMVEWLISHEGMTEDEAVEWIDYNTIRALPYMGDDHPIIYRSIQ